MTGSLRTKNASTLDLSEEVREFIAESPESSPLRSLNPNLQRSESDIDCSAINIDIDIVSPPPLPQRSSTLRRKKPIGANPFLESTENGVEKSVDYTQPQPFWKFHILRFGSDLYLTTNPTSRHLHCRNAPGYFVTISGNEFEYSMAFEDMESGELLVEIDKVAHKRSSYFDFVVRKERSLRDGSIRSISEKEPLSEPCNGRKNGIEPLLSNGSSKRDEKKTENIQKRPTEYSGRMVREPIPPRLLPTPPITPMTSYATKMVDGEEYSIGSLPRYKEHRQDLHETKYIAKKNVYLHRCFADLERYFEWTIPPAIAVYRECEARPKKRVMRQLNRLSLSRAGSVLTKGGLPRADASPYSEVASLYKCGDGTYFDKVPADDEPDHHHKLGWVTIYEDARLFSKPGMFDLTVALTVAIGYERNLSFGHIEHEGH